jgi:hypothetical protein
MDFVETMAEYLDGYRQDWDNTLTAKLARIEKKYPGFTERYKKFGNNVERYREIGDDALLIELLHEGYVIDGIFEEDQIEQMRLNLHRSYDRARTWKPEDIGLIRKETEC